ncbi:hypothetical protein JCM10213_006941 [Rhodosporidiobolus nylandii]
MASESTTGCRDHLSALPVELLERIFELAYEGEDTTTGAISRALLPFDRAERFKRVGIASAAVLERFEQAMEAKPHLARCVKELDLRDADSPHDPSSYTFRTLCALLPRLSRLHFDHRTPSLCDLFTSETCLSLFLSQLQHLSLSLGVDDPDDPPEVVCNPALLRHLDSLPSIDSLTVDVSLASPEDVSDEVIKQWKAVSLSSIRTLTILGEYFNVNFFVGLAKACPFLSSLTLDNRALEPRYARGLANLAPLSAHLTSLSLLAVAEYDDWTTDSPCDAYLPHFPHLTYVHLGEGIFDETTLFPNLRALLSLSTFVLGGGASVDASELLSLVEGPTRHPALTVLTLDNIRRGVRGRRIAGEGGSGFDLELAGRHQYRTPGWILPNYTDPHPRFSTSAVEEVHAAGQRNGVKVDGTAVDQIAFYRDWREEAIEALVLWGAKQGTFDELRNLLGTDEADKLLKARGLQDGDMSESSNEDSD